MQRKAQIDDRGQLVALPHARRPQPVKHLARARYRRAHQRLKRLVGLDPRDRIDDHGMARQQVVEGAIGGQR